jgi:hypothetical protein
VKLLLGCLLMWGAPLVFAQQLGQQTCPTVQPIIIAYGNGIRRTSPQAGTDLAYLQEKITPPLSAKGINPADVAFCPIYDSTYYEAQASQAPSLYSFDTFLQGFQALVQLGLQTPEQFLYWLSNSPAAPAQFNQIEESINAAVDAAVSLKPSATGFFCICLPG